MTAQFDKTEAPLTEAQTVALDTDNSPPINGQNEFVACCQMARDMNVIAHYKALSDHDQKELTILEKRIIRYKNEHEQQTTETV